MASPNKTPPSATVPPPLPPSRPAPAPAPPPPRGGANTTRSPRRDFQVTTGRETKAQKTVIFGPGGIGKTELCALIKQVGIEPQIIDLEDGSSFLDVRRVKNIDTWDDLRDALHAESLWDGVGAVVIDSLTKAEELAAAWTIANVKNEKGNYVSSIEGYGYGKGYGHLYDTFLNLLSDLDAHARKGRHIICVSHECTANVPNPSGEDFIRYEPRLSSPTSGKASIRLRVKEWCDHLIFIGYDKSVNEDGKAIGSGTRTIYTQEFPAWMAKSRSLSEPIPYEKGNSSLWEQIFNRKGE